MDCRDERGKKRGQKKRVRERERETELTRVAWKLSLKSNFSFTLSGFFFKDLNIFAAVAADGQAQFLPSFLSHSLPHSLIHSLFAPQFQNARRRCPSLIRTHNTRSRTALPTTRHSVARLAKNSPALSLDLHPSSSAPSSIPCAHAATTNAPVVSLPILHPCAAPL